jgi:hypothetical protein
LLHLGAAHCSQMIATIIASTLTDPLAITVSVMNDSP